MRVQPCGQLLDHFRQPGFFNAVLHPLQVNARGGLRHRLCHGDIHDVKMLEHCRKQPVILSPVKLPNVGSIQQNTPLVRVQQTGHKLDQRSLTRSV